MDQPASQSKLRIPIWLLRFLQFLQKHVFNTAHSRSLYNCGWFVSIFHYLFLHKVPILVPLFLLRVLSRFDNLIFMNLRTTEASSVVSYKSGNECYFFSWILFCLLPMFLGTPIAYVPFLLIKAIDLSPSTAFI